MLLGLLSTMFMFLTVTHLQLQNSASVRDLRCKGPWWKPIAESHVLVSVVQQWVTAKGSLFVQYDLFIIHFMTNICNRTKIRNRLKCIKLVWLIWELIFKNTFQKFPFYYFQNKFFFQKGPHVNQIKNKDMYPFHQNTEFSGHQKKYSLSKYQKFYAP